MTLPSNFTPVNHFKDVCLKTYNRIVREHFRDIDETLDPDITTPRSSLRTACLIDDKDSSILINNRMMLFYFVLRAAQDLQAPIYGIPTGTYHETFKFKPQIFLYFHEDLGDQEPGFQPLRSQISFRLMEETETTLTKAKLTQIATKIKQEFGLNNGYKFRRGRFLCTYNDPDNGYKLKLFTISESEAKEVIRKVLDIQNHIYDSANFNYSANDSPATAYPIMPPQKTILGKPERMPRKRPVGTVRFSHSTIALWGKNKPVTLYSRTGILRDGLVN